MDAERHDELKMLRLRTERMELFGANAALADADAHDRGRLAELVAARVPDDWPPDLMADSLEFFAQKLMEYPDQAGWWAWYWVLQETPDSERVLVGSGGFSGVPNDHGVVDVGYAVLDGYQNLGLATEAMEALVDWAFRHPQVLSVCAETFPASHPASLRVMEKLAMARYASGKQPGAVRFCIRREHWEERQPASS